MKILLLAICLVFFTACASQRFNDDFGKVHRSNMQVQTADSSAKPVAEPNLDGQKAQQVMEHYRKDSGKTDEGSLLTEMGSSR